MAISDYLVLICRSYHHKPESNTNILGVPEARDELGKEGLEFRLSEDSSTWTILGIPHSKPVRHPIGQNTEFESRPEVRYKIGVYNQRDSGQMIEMVRTAEYIESERHPGIDDGD
jgi:hypothetical protein